MAEEQDYYQGGQRAQRNKDVKNFWGDPEKNKEALTKAAKFGEAAALYKRDCVKCGAPLGFGKTMDGKTIPLDLRAPVYCVTGEKNPRDPDGCIRTHLAFVSHFATCPEANHFSSSKKE